MKPMSYYSLVMLTLVFIAKVCCKDIKCGKKHSDYKKIYLKQLKKHEGELVMVKSRITYSDSVSCTKIGCSEANPCCNNCSRSSINFKKKKFRKVILTPKDKTVEDIGCYGSNCDWEDNCAYSRSKMVIVYGKVTKENGSYSIIVDKHCKEKNNEM